MSVSTVGLIVKFIVQSCTQTQLKTLHKMFFLFSVDQKVNEISFVVHFKPTMGYWVSPFLLKFLYLTLLDNLRKFGLLHLANKIYDNFLKDSTIIKMKFWKCTPNMDCYIQPNFIDDVISLKMSFENSDYQAPYNFFHLFFSQISLQDQISANQSIFDFRNILTFCSVKTYNK